jgi:hypothetical protein
MSTLQTSLSSVSEQNAFYAKNKETLTQRLYALNLKLQTADRSSFDVSTIEYVPPKTTTAIHNASLIVFKWYNIKHCVLSDLVKMIHDHVAQGLPCTVEYGDNDLDDRPVFIILIGNPNFDIAVGPQTEKPMGLHIQGYSSSFLACALLAMLFVTLLTVLVLFILLHKSGHLDSWLHWFQTAI